jgi:enterochelin esterase family protein
MQLHEISVSDPAGKYTRKVWRSGKADGRPVCILLDGELYLERVGAEEAIEGLITAGRLPPLDWIFVSNLDAAARHHDYTCNASYGRFIAESVLPADAGGDNYICGLSLSGLAAAHIALSFPRRFTGALCQSGSFWWEDGRFADLAGQAGPSTGRFWLSVGDEETETGASHPPTGLRQEISQLESVAEAAVALRAIGCTVEHRVYHGGHDPAQWNDELPEALQWLMG